MLLKGAPDLLLLNNKKNYQGDDKLRALFYLSNNANKNGLQELHISCVLSGERLTCVDVSIGDVEPRDQQAMTPSDLSARRCGQVTTPVGGGAKVTVMGPPQGVTERYLVVQIRGRSDYLTLFEVEVAGKSEYYSFIIVTTLLS